jgi:hypothetical protein
MQITFSSTGGFTGPAGTERCHLSQAQLSAAQVAQLRAQLAAADFFALPPKLLKPVPQSWDFLQELQVALDGRQHTVQFHSGMASAALNALADNIRELHGA